MISSRLFPIRTRISGRITTVFDLLFIGAALILCTPSVYAADYRRSGSQREAVEGTRSGNSGNSSSSFQSSPGVDTAEQAQQQRLSEAYNANHQAIEFQKNGAWAKALSLFEEAARKSPDDPVIRDNVARVRAYVAVLQAREKEEREAAERQRQDKAAANDVQRSIQNFAQSLNAAPVSDGLDFDGRTSGSSPSGGANSSGLDFTAAIATPSQAKSASAVPSGDPMVVDARTVPSGLPKPVESAIAGAYQNAPPGVSDRVRKGFQAVMDRDWKVAKAWFEDALNRDPGNAGLKRLVALSGNAPALDRQAATSTAGQRGALEMPNPNDIKFLFPGLQALDEAEALDLLFGIPPSR